MTPHMIEQQRRILEALEGGKRGHIEVGIALGFSRSAAQKYMRKMHEGKPKLIYICGYEQPATGGYPRALFAAGDLPDLEYQPKYVKKSKRPTPRKQEQTEKILSLLCKPMTSREVCEAIHLSYEQTVDYIRILRDSTPKQAYIKGYRPPPSRGQWAPLYAAGNKPDAPHPEEQTRAERYKKERSSEEVIERANKLRKHKYLVKTLKKSPVSWAAALGL